MEEERTGGKGLWIILFAVALVAALVFATLWYLRGGDINRLTTAVETNRLAAESVSGRLERELRSARADAEESNRKASDLDTRLRDEQRRSADTVRQVERRLRDEADSAHARVRDMEEQIGHLRNELAAYENAQPESSESKDAQTAHARSPSTGKAGIAGIAAGVGLAAAAVPLHAEMEALKNQLAAVRESAGTRERELSLRLAGVRESADQREKDLSLRLADAMREKEELAGTVGDLKASLNNVGLELTTANEDLQSSESLKKQLSEAEGSVRTLEGKVGDLEANNSHLRAELVSAQQDLEKAARLPELETELATARQKIEELQGQVTTYEKEHSGLRNDLSDLNLQLQQAKSEGTKAGLLDDSLSAAKKAAEESEAKIQSLMDVQAGLRKDLAAAYADLKSKEKEREGGETAGNTSEIETRLASLSAELEAAGKREAESRDSIQALRKELDEARAGAADREKALAASVERLESENRAARDRIDAWRKIVPRSEAGGAEQVALGDDVNNAIAKLEADAAAGAASMREAENLRKRIEELTGERERVRTEGLERLRLYTDETKADFGRLEKRISELEEENAGLRRDLTAARADLDADRKKAAGDLEALREQHNKERSEWEQAQTQAQAQRDTDAASGVAMRDDATSPAEPMETAKSAETVEPIEQSVEPVHYFVKDPVRSVGEISGMLSGGGFEIDIGSRHGVKPGMRFDVHRPMGNMNWFIGVLRVNTAKEYTSEASLTPVAGAKICPVTGRAVLDSSSRFSPYVYADDNRPVPLLEAKSLGLGNEIPAIGDRIDNPYFDPARRMGFWLNPALSPVGEILATSAVADLGGRLMEGGEDASGADYIVVENGEPEYRADGVLRTTPSQLSSYVTR